MWRRCGRQFDFCAENQVLDRRRAFLSADRAKIILVISNKTASIDARQSSGVRSSSFTAMNAGVSSEAVFFTVGRRNFSEPARYLLV
jgi:hypothetical protein